jgi:DNA-binding beta-propeller fold protein YncE
MDCGGRGTTKPARLARRSHRLASALVLALAIGAWLQAAVGAGAPRHDAPAVPVGALLQLPGARGCLSERPRDGCRQARALAGAGGLAVAGSFVYVAAVDSSAVAIFKRDPATGALHQLAGRAGCVSEGAKEGCARGRGLVGAFSVAVSPNGRSLYVASVDGVATFARNPSTGRLTQLPGAAGCIAEYPGDGCGPGRALNQVASVAVSPDGKNVYAASYASNAVVALTRDPSTGALSQAPGLSGCTNEDGAEGCQQGKALLQTFSLVVSPDGRYVYVGSIGSNAVVSFEREQDGSLRQIPFPGECTSEGGLEGCATGRGLNEVAGVAISPGGGYLYAGASRSSAVAAMFLTSTTGGIDQLKGPYGCTAERGVEGCATGHGLVGAGPLAVSPDGRTLYAAGLNSLSAFARQLSDGRIDQLPGIHACFTEGRGQDGCAAARGLGGASSIAVSPDGRWVYVAALPSSRNGTVAVFARVPGPITLHVRLTGDPHSCIAAPFHISALARGTVPVKSLRLALDGRVVARAHQDQLSHRVDARRLRHGMHTLRATAVDLLGDTRQVSDRFRRC